MTCPACLKPDCRGGPVECHGHVAHGRVWVNGCECQSFCGLHDAGVLGATCQCLDNERTNDERAE